MKVAEVMCLANSTTNHRGPSGQKYRFRAGSSVPVSDLDDARYFEESNFYEVEWTARGQLADLVSQSESSPTEAIESFGYNAKQSLAKAFGIKANQTDEELTEELEEAASDLQEQMEIQ